VADAHVGLLVPKTTHVHSPRCGGGGPGPAFRGLTNFNFLGYHSIGMPRNGLARAWEALAIG
jgi:hypothetical protein